MRYRLGVPVMVAWLALGGCGSLSEERGARGSAPADTRRVVFEVVARNGRCEPSVLAADRDGRSLLITFQVTSVDRSHYFLLPDADIRKAIPVNQVVEIPWVADRSGIHAYACTASRWIMPFASTGKLAIK